MAPIFQAPIFGPDLPATSDFTDAPEAFRRFIEARVHQSLLNYLAVMEASR